MPLVTPTELRALADQLQGAGGLRTARIDIDFEPFDFARTGAALVDRAVAYAMPNGDQLVGLGTAWHSSTSGPSRFDRLASAMRGLDDDELTCFVGYAFGDEEPGEGLWRDFGSAEAFVPRIGIRRTGHRSSLTVAIPADEETGPTLELLASMRRPSPIPVIDAGDHTIESYPHVGEWANLVADTVKVIEAGELDKVVLARSVTVASSEPVAILRVFRELVASYGQCYVFAWKSFGSVLMGASPELLAEVDAGAFRSNPLAGSARRGEGDDEDESIGNALVASDKDQREHRLVVDDMRRRLGGLVEDIHIPERPSLKKMATVQHLSTEITGRTAPHVTVLDAVAALHPTPAVGGVPTDDAVAYIRSNEQIDRGWYTGGVGWMSPNGDGSMAITLRCGLINDDTTHLFAGAGIVAGSDPAAEVVETRLKLRPLLDILAAT